MQMSNLFPKRQDKCLPLFEKIISFFAFSTFRIFFIRFLLVYWQTVCLRESDNLSVPLQFIAISTLSIVCMP